jgi:hypothetical protein
MIGDRARHGQCVLKPVCDEAVTIRRLLYVVGPELRFIGVRGLKGSLVTIHNSQVMETAKMPHH